MAATETVSCRATGRIAAPSDQVYARVFDSARFPELFRGYGPVPGISFIAPDADGYTRRVVLSDGNELRERFDVMEPDRRLLYQADGFGVPLRWWCRAAQGEWRFQPDGDGTEVTWLYAFQASNAFAAWAIRIGVAPFFRRAMADCVRRLTIACEAVRHQ